MGKLARVVAMAAVAVVGAWSCTPAAPKAAFKYGEVRGQLAKNGLRFVVVPDPTTQLTEVDVRYEVGAREDPPGKAGLAHLVEHLMFQQRPDGPGTPVLMHVLQQLTLSMNAYTAWDMTHYMLNARAELLDGLVKIEAMRMFYGCQTISEDEFLREREVVRNEIRRSNREPEALVPQLTLAAMYPRGHAYAHLIGGDDEQLSTMTLRDACEFMHKYYVPERAVVIIAGGISSDAAIHSVEKWFNALDRRAPAPRRAVEPLAGTSGRSTVEVDLERPWITVAWPLPDARTPEGEAAQFGIWSTYFDGVRKADRYECAAQGFPAITGGREAPIWTIRARLGATYGTYARRDAHVGASAYYLGGAVDAPRAGEALRAMRAGIDALRSGAEFDAMFVRARRKVVQELIGGSVVSTELASDLGEIAQFGADPGYQSTLLRQAAALSPVQVKQLLARELDPSGEVIVLLGDRAAVTKAFAEAGIADARLVEPGGQAVRAR